MARTTSLVSALLAAAIVHASLPARAQSAPPAQAAPAAPPADIVRLKNGGFVRGTIIEAMPNDHVDLQLATGETRRFAWSDVEYAGPDDRPAPPQARPAPPPPPAAPSSPAAAEEPEVHFEADGADELRLHLRTGESEFVGMAGGHAVVGVARRYEPLCVAPCSTRLPVGTHRLALSSQGGRPIEAPDGVSIEGPSLVHGHYESYTGTRVAGWITIGLSVVAGTALTMTSIKDKQDCTAGPDFCMTTKTIDGTQLALGLGVMTVGMLVGFILVFKHDEVTFTVSPLSVGAARLEGRTASAGARPDGLAVTMSY